MSQPFGRREFLQATITGSALCMAGGCIRPKGPGSRMKPLVSTGCRRSKVRVGKLYLGQQGGHWPTPKLDLKAEIQRYEAQFARMKPQLTDVDFVGNQLVSSPEQVRALSDTLQGVDGILAIHLSMRAGETLNEILSLGRPTMFFAAPYSGHEWSRLGTRLQEESGTRLDCVLTSDYDELAVAVRPFRAIHHLREAKIIDVTMRQPSEEFVKSVREKFGTEIKVIGREPVLDAYNAISMDDARAEADRWIRQAERVMEPSKDEILRSCRLALAFERILDAGDATVITVDCYGSMYHQLPAFPCIGFTRLNNMGLGGICESDLQSALTHILFQGLAGKPGFISDPTVDESNNSIILAHCLGTTKMDGPAGKAAPYRLRSIMERQEGAVPQVRMRIGQKVTQARFVGTDLVVCFTGEIIGIPDTDRGCRTKIAVKVDGEVGQLWRNWAHGLHRVTCYGDLTKDLRRFCRFKGVRMVNEALESSSA